MKEPTEAKRYFKNHCVDILNLIHNVIFIRFQNIRDHTISKLEIEEVVHEIYKFYFLSNKQLIRFWKFVKTKRVENKKVEFWETFKWCLIVDIKSFNNFKFQHATFRNLTKGAMLLVDENDFKYKYFLERNLKLSSLYENKILTLFENFNFSIIDFSKHLKITKPEALALLKKEYELSKIVIK